MARLLLALTFGVLTTAVSGAAPTTPIGWFMGAGGNLGKYASSLDHDGPLEGAACARLSSQSATPAEFATLMQAANAASFIGKRVRFTAQVKSKDVAGSAYLWFRADRADGASIAFDNMQNRPIRGSTDWQLYSLVLDVPESATVLAYGIGLSGSGTTWLDAAQIEVVDQTVPTSGKKRNILPKPPIGEKWIKAAPFNLNFEN